MSSTQTLKRTSCVLGIDLGTSAVKIVAVSRDGRTIAHAREPYRTISKFEGQAEQSCDDWLKALRLAARTISTRLKPRVRVQALALTGQIPTLVVLENNKSVAPAITWQDSRADRWATNKIVPRHRREMYLKTGMLIDGRYLAPMFQFHHGTSPHRASLILSAKDFLFHALTGVTVTDPSTASGFGVYNLRTNAWDLELCKLWGVSVEQLPAIKSPSFSAPLTKRGSRLIGCKAGTPVILGCADSVAGAHALGGDQDSKVATILTGSSTVILKSDAEPQWDPGGRYLLTPLALDGRFGREADLLASGSAREWVENILLGPRYKTSDKNAMWKAVYRAAAGTDGLFFAPFLAGGEQGVLWDPDLKGSISGLTLRHDRTGIARALLEGMCFEIRRCLQVLEGSTPITSVRVAGWMAEIPEQCQLLADVLGRAVHSFRLSSASALGAALLTGLLDTQKYFRRQRATIFNPSTRKIRYNELYAKYGARFPSRD